jgi:hypothetical protein
MHLKNTSPVLIKQVLSHIYKYLKILQIWLLGLEQCVIILEQENPKTGHFNK